MQNNFSTAEFSGEFYSFFMGYFKPSTESGPDLYNSSNYKRGRGRSHCHQERVPVGFVSKGATGPVRDPLRFTAQTGPSLSPQVQLPRRLHGQGTHLRPPRGAVCSMLRIERGLSGLGDDTREGPGTPPGTR